MGGRVWEHRGPEFPQANSVLITNVVSELLAREASPNFCFPTRRVCPEVTRNERHAGELKRMEKQIKIILDACSMPSTGYGRPLHELERCGCRSRKRHTIGHTTKTVRCRCRVPRSMTNIRRS